MDSSQQKMDSKVIADPKPAELRADNSADAETLFAAMSTFLAQASSREGSTGTVSREPARDLTEEIPSMEDRYKVLVEQIPAVVFMAFLDGGVSETYVSPQVEQVLGFSREEWLDDPIRWYQQIHPDDRQRWSVEAAEILLKGNPLKSVYRVIARDGHVVWFHCEARLVRRKDGQPWFVHGVGFDITDLKQTEQALQQETAERERLQRLELERQIAKNQQTESRLAAIVESSEDSIVSKNLDGVITSWNKSAELMFGYEPEEAIGKHITLIVPHDRLSEETTIIERLKRGERVEHFETIRVRKDGTALDVSVTISPLRDAAGNVVGASKVARDITARKRAQKELEKGARRQKALFQLADQLHRATSVEHVYTGALDAIFGALQCDRAAILLLDEGPAMRFVSWRGLSDGYRLAVEGHSAWRHGEPDPQVVCIADVSAADLRDGVKDAVTKEGIGALAFIPLVWNGKLIGKFMSYFNEPHLFSDEEVELSLTIARQLAFGIERKRAEEALRHSEERFRHLAETLDTQVRARTRELEERNAEVLRQSEELRSLSFRLLKAQDDERRHLARELHDSAGQVLAMLGMNLARIVERVKKEAPDVAKYAEETQQLVQQLTDDVRTASYLLHPPLLDESGLSAALRWYIQGLEKRSDLQIKLTFSEDFGRLPSDMELVVFRLVQECLTNVHRHSGSKSGTIYIERGPERVSVVVEDQGKGMSPERLAEIQSQGSGVGIRGMRERLRQFKGDLTIESSNCGTRISATIPIPRDLAYEQSARSIGAAM